MKFNNARRWVARRWVTLSFSKVMQGLSIGLCFVALFFPVAGQAAVEEVVSPYGFKAWLIEDHSLPIISFQMAFKHSGYAYDPKAKEGLAFFVRSLLDEGAGDLDATAFKQKLEDYNIHLSFEVDQDNFYVTVKTLTENLDQTLSLLKLALVSPRFDDDAIQRVRGQMYTLIASQKESPDAIANEAFNRAFFGKHPYGNRTLGTKKTLQTITKEDLQHFTKIHFSRVPLVISAAGDIRPEKLKEALDKYFLELPLTTANDGTVEEFTHFPEGKEMVVNLNVPQSTVIFGNKGVKRDDPDFYAAYVLNYILGGGGFSSRLMEEVREKKGLAYSIATSLDMSDHAGILKGYVATQNAKIHESLAIIRQVMEDVKKNGVTEKELNDAKSYLTGSFALNLDKNEKLAYFLQGMQLENLGMDFLEKRNQYVESLTLKDVNRVAATLLVPDNLTVVVVGNQKEMQTDIQNTSPKKL